MIQRALRPTPPPRPFTTPTLPSPLTMRPLKLLARPLQPRPQSPGFRPSWRSLPGCVAACSLDTLPEWTPSKQPLASWTTWPSRKLLRYMRLRYKLLRCRLLSCQLLLTYVTHWSFYCGNANSSKLDVGNYLRSLRARVQHSKRVLERRVRRAQASHPDAELCVGVRRLMCPPSVQMLIG